MRKISGILLLFLFTAVLHGEWWDENQFQWKKSKEIFSGISYIHLKKNSPRVMQLHVMRIDLNKKFKFHTSKKSDKYGQIIPTHKKKNLYIHTTRQKTADFMMQARKKKINMIVAINAAPWSPWDGVSSPYATNLGLLISDGEVVSPARKGRPSLIVYRNGKVELREVGIGEKTDNIAQAVSGFGFILRNGKVLPSGKGLAPRTGFGLSGDKRFLYLIVVDGRQPGFSMGCNEAELGAMMKYFGAENALNMDGGGSSSMVILDKKHPGCSIISRKVKYAMSEHLWVFQLLKSEVYHG